MAASVHKRPGFRGLGGVYLALRGTLLIVLTCLSCARVSRLGGGSVDDVLLPSAWVELLLKLGNNFRSVTLGHVTIAYVFRWPSTLPTT